MESFNSRSFGKNISSADSYVYNLEVILSPCGIGNRFNEIV